jgi:hypothetical protein
MFTSLIRRRRSAILIAAAFTSTAFVGQPALAARAFVTTGTFETTATGIARGFDIDGHAVMVRSPRAGGTTHVVSLARGLEPGLVYGSHVHNGACGDGGGGHYQHVPGGGVDPFNEMWPTLEPGPGGVAAGSAHHAHIARDDARSIVIHDPSDGARIACLDLT